MKVRMFAVQDLQAGAFHAPFPAPSEGVALRMMADCVSRQGHPYMMHPADYVLFEVGTYEEETAFMEALSPRTVCNLVTLANKQEG